jgi:hypothetical protein
VGHESEDEGRFEKTRGLRFQAMDPQGIHLSASFALTEAGSMLAGNAVDEALRITLDLP